MIWPQELIADQSPSSDPFHLPASTDEDPPQAGALLMGREKVDHVSYGKNVVSIVMGVPKMNGWSNPIKNIKMDDLGVPPFQETSNWTK